MDFTASLLWQYALAERPNDTMSVERDRLRASYLTFRERAGELATEIGITLPQLTKHDLSHIDALWEISSELVKDELTRSPNYINPLEAFVLGGAFLIHDLAQSEAALPFSLSKVRDTAKYKDALRRISGDLDQVSRSSAAPTAGDAEKTALLLYLRDSHAELARSLISRFWEDDNGCRHYLLMDEDFREFLGNSIGRLAASHHLPADQLPSEFPYPLGSPPFLHFGDCDLLKLSMIIRAADAINFDGRRAPSLVACFRRLRGVSKKHWDAQKYLHKASFQNDSVFFTSDHAFSFQERDAWWLCFDAIGAIDTELLEVDALLTDLKRPRLRARSVSGAHSPQRLQKLIPTAGWIPVDTQIRVNNAIGLVRRLGGKELYGDDPSVPLRELVQNARDAIAARKGLEPGFEGGKVSVSLRRANKSWLLIIQDDGIGMSEKVLSGPLLDFGASFWNSDLAAVELPGLQASRFSPTGRYGIGFFSSFMLGSKVQVVTRRFDRGRDEARVLDFIEGLSSRPVLRKVTFEDDAPIGTRVEIEFDKDPYKHGGLLGGDGNSRPRLSLNELGSWLFPAFDCDIRTREGDGDWQFAVRSCDWRTLAPADLLKRVIKARSHRRPGKLEQIISDSGPLLRDIRTKDDLVARACILATNNRYIDNATDLGVLTVGGARAASVHRVGGIFSASPSRAARDQAYPTASESAIQDWASEQARLISASDLSIETKVNAASVVRGFAGNVGDLPIAWSTKGWHDTSQIIELAKKFREIIIISDSSKSLLTTNRKLKFLPNVLVTGTGRYSGFGDTGFMSWSHPNAWHWEGSPFHFWTCEGAVVEAIAKGWQIDLSKVLKDAIQSTDDHSEVRVVAHTTSGDQVSDDCDVIILR